MKKLIIRLALGLVFLGIAGVAVLISYAQWSYPHPSGEHVVVTKDNAVLAEKVIKKKEALEEAKRAGLYAKAIVDHTEFDFGTMDPSTTASHTFVLRNEGTGPLKVTNGGTTCKCTVGKVSNGIVMPGEEAEVMLTWNTGLENTSYEHGAKILLTNDPQRESIQLTVRGTVRTRLGATRRELVFSALEPDHTSATLSTTLFTQMYSELTLDKASCTLEGVTWRVAAADPAESKVLKARAAQRVSVTLPDEMPTGAFHGQLRLEFLAKTSPDAEPERELFDLDISGHVGHRLALYGDDIDTDGIVDFGVITEGQGKRIGLLMKVRDSQHEISVKGLDVRPDFVKVSITPHGSGEAHGLYRLVLEVPPDAPQCVYMRKTMGELRIEFDHPRIKELLLRLSLAVAPGGL